MSESNIVQNMYESMINAPQPTVWGSLFAGPLNWKMIVGLVVGAIVLVVVAIAGYTYYKLSNSPWWSERSKVESNVLGGLSNLMKEKPVVKAAQSLDTEIKTDEEEPEIDPDFKKIARIRETWCLVGEDLSGRYCVKVPDKSLCPSDRKYPSRDACELTPANHMPTGVMKDRETDLTFMYTKRLF